MVKNHSEKSKIKMAFYSAPLALALILIAVLPTMAFSIYDKLLFFPMKELERVQDSINGFQKEDVSIKSANGKIIHAWFFLRDPKSKVILLSHGNAGNISHRTYLISLLLNQGLSVLAYDYQGYGKSEGKPTIANVCEDGLSAFDYLVKEKNYSPQDIILYGESLGGGITCHIAKNRKPGALILQSTFSSLPSVAKKVYKIFHFVPSIAYPKNKLDNLALVKDKHPPLLIIHGKVDEIIPFSEAELLNKNATEPKLYKPIKGAGHNNLYPSFSHDLKTAISEFFTRYKLTSQ